MSINNLNKFNRLKNDVDQELEVICKIIKDYSLTSKNSAQENKEEAKKALIDILCSLRTKLMSSAFKILVVGEFSNGKSTFLNAILGNKILPTATTETTATINIIKHGSSPKVVIFYWGAKDEYGREITPGNKEEVSIGSLKDYTALTELSNHNAQKIKYIEIYYPSKYCENGIELVDTPGLNTTYCFHEENTLNYLQNGHAGILLLNATQFLSASEDLYIKTFRKHMTKFMFVANRFDEVMDSPDDPRDEHLKYCEKKLRRILEVKDNTQLYPLNAKLAEKGDWDGSGMKKFVDDFEEFLTSGEKAKEMIHPVINQALEIVRSEKLNAEMLLGALNFSPEEFEKRINENLPKIAKVKRTKDELISFISDRTGLILTKFERYTDDILSDRALSLKSEVLSWEGDVEDLQKELPNYIKKGLIGALEEIQDMTGHEVSKLQEEASRRYQDLQNEIVSVKQLIGSIEGNKMEITSLVKSNVSFEAENPAWLEGKVIEFGGAVGIGALAAMIFAGPFAVVVGSIGGALIRALFAEKQRQKKLHALADKLYAELTGSTNAAINKGKSLIENDMSKFKENMSKNFTIAINSIEESIKQIRIEQKSAQYEIELTRKNNRDYISKLDTAETSLLKIKSHLME